MRARREKARKLLRLWCWFIFVSMILSFVRLRSAESASLLTANPMAGFWWLLFGGYALRKGGVLDHPGGYRKAAWVTGALTGLSVFMVVHGLGLISAWELPSGRATAIAPLWFQVVRVTLVVLTGWLTIVLFRAGRAWQHPAGNHPRHRVIRVAPRAADYAGTGRSGRQGVILQSDRQAFCAPVAVLGLEYAGTAGAT